MNSDIKREELLKYSKYYRKHLLKCVMPFWEKRSKDKKFGGYFNSFDRTGNNTNTNKNIQFQARMLWMYSALYNYLEERPLWLDLARHGHDFLILHAYAGDGSWYHQLNRCGKVMIPDRDLLTDGFIILSLIEYALASKSDKDLKIISLSLNRYIQKFYSPDLAECKTYRLNPYYLYHNRYVVTMDVALAAAKIVKRSMNSTMDHCIEKIMHVFAKDEYEILFEIVNLDGSLVDTLEGRKINPGHIMESMWFCMREGCCRKDLNIIKRALQISNWAIQKGWDHKQGGIFAYINPDGKEPFIPRSLADLGETWDTKIWWVHAESLYNLALGSIIGNRMDFWQKFKELHEYTQKYFYDDKYGEWYTYLHRNGMHKITDKATRNKTAFHLPRALMNLTLLFENEYAKCHCNELFESDKKFSENFKERNIYKFY